MSGGGGGGTTNTAQFKPPDYALQGWADIVTNAGQITQGEYAPYYGMEIAPINNAQAQGMQYMSNLAGNQAPDMATARAMNQLTAAGGYENPYATMQTENGANPWQYTEAAPQIEINKYRDGQVGPAVNQYMGFSPEYQAFKQSALDDVVGNYQRGTAAQTDSAMNRAGAFGGGAHIAQISQNEGNLARNLARQSSEMDFGQWDRSAGLSESGIARDLAARQADYARNAGLEEGAIARVNDTKLADYARNSQLAEAALNRGFQGQTNDLNRASQYWDMERNRQMQSLPLAIQGHQSDLGDAQRMIGVGDAQRQYQQDMLNAQRNNYQQYQNWPFEMIDKYSNLLARASGNYGQQSSQQQQNYQTNPYAALIGGGLLGAGMYAGS